MPESQKPSPPDESSQDILSRVWTVFKDIAKYLLLYLIMYAVLKFIIAELAGLDYEAVAATLALIVVLATYYFVRKQDNQ
ncbi:MAG: hypothetical protein MAGBODY4_00332 [Candidatus Marinimicrobia bacterium]|nr:hypothetical protein [Candidatus Neomarinimicrobiota bacterium]